MPIRRRLANRRFLAVFAAGLVVAIGVGVAAAMLTRGPSSSTPIVGVQLDRPLPTVPLRDARGRRITLGSFRGKVVVLAPVLTLCHEVCPLTAGAFMTMQRVVDRAGLGDDVVFAEISVDPWRDSPARLRAFARRTGIELTLLTGAEPVLRRFWRAFGVGFFRVAQGKPPDVDWWTGKPETFDVAHSNGIFFVDREGKLRIALLGIANVRGALADRLRRLLNDEGLRNLEHPDVPWTVPQALNDLSALLGRPIPYSTEPETTPAK